MDPLTAKKARKKGKKEEQFFEAPDVAGILLLSQPGREPGRVGYEKQRERERILPSSFLQLFLKISNRFFPIQPCLTPQTSRGLIHTTPLSRITTAILATVG